MKNINLKTTSSFLSIPNGFEWKNIPQFAIITGKNGVGKTHLLSLISRHDTYLIVLDDNNQQTKLISTQSSNEELSINGLIEYKNSYLERLARISEYNDNIKTHSSSINYIKQKLEHCKDEIEEQKIREQIRRGEEYIVSKQNRINSLTIYPYENELEKLAKITGKSKRDITDEEIREYSNPIYNALLDEKDFEKYLRQDEEIRNKKIILYAEAGQFDKVKKICERKKVHEKINEYFLKYGFNHYKMLDPFPKDETSRHHKNLISFKGKNGEIVGFPDLSSGEQMIVKLIIWAMGADIKGQRINTMILDEPDAHLHPSLNKIMVEILSEISNSGNDEGFGIRVIISTHSPSTVAFAPEGSLFVMKRKDDGCPYIEPTNAEDAISNLCDGIFSYDKTIRKFSKIVESNHNNILLVEGKTDVIHLKKAMDILDFELDIDIIDMHDAGSLAAFMKAAPSKFTGEKRVIALFDCDNAGINAYRNLNGNEEDNIKQLSYEQGKGYYYAIVIRSPEGLEQYCPIEFLYKHEYLNDNKMLIKRSRSEYCQVCSNQEIDNDETFNRLDSGSDLRAFKVSKDLKKSFSMKISQEVDPVIFEGFRPTLELISQIISKK